MGTFFKILLEFLGLILFKFPIVTVIFIAYFYIGGKKLQHKWKRLLIPFWVLLLVEILIIVVAAVNHLANTTFGLKGYPDLVSLYIVLFTLLVMGLGVVIAWAAANEFSVMSLYKTYVKGVTKGKKSTSKKKKQTNVTTTQRIFVMGGVLVVTPVVGLLLGNAVEVLQGDKSGIPSAGGIVLGFMAAVCGLILGPIVSFITKNSKDQRWSLAGYIAPTLLFTVYMLLNLL